MKLSRNAWYRIGGVVIGIGIVALVMFFYRGADVSEAPPLPVPNGYDDFLAAQKLLVHSLNAPLLPSEQGFNMPVARAHFGSNGPALSRVRIGLTKNCAVPLLFTNNWISSHINDLSGMKGLARNLQLGGALERLDGRFTNALAYDLDILRLATQINHGGLVIDNLVASANENIAFSELERLEPSLTAAQCRNVIGEIEKWNKDREPFSETLAREKQWSFAYARLEYNPVQLALLRIRSMIAAKLLNPEAAAMQRATAKQKQVFLRAANLQATLAAHAFKDEHKSAPKSWSDLVPAYLPVVPTNSETGRPLTLLFSE